ncbi:MAG: hypothetical protein M3Y74_01445 [Chloroflexota bacterium]|nr:hypothetical protein [Chloroflexota bacterium]
MSTDRIVSTVRVLRARWETKDLTHEDLAAGLRRAADRLDQAYPREAALARRWREDAWALDERADATRDPLIVSETPRAATDPTLI